MSDNLIPSNKRSKNEAREMGKKGGKASGEARRRKRNMLDAAQIILSLPPPDKRPLKKLISEVGIDDVDLRMAILWRIAQKALYGDIRAASFLRDTAGEKPWECIAFSPERDMDELYSSNQFDLSILSDDELHMLIHIQEKIEESKKQRPENGHLINDVDNLPFQP